MAFKKKISATYNVASAREINLYLPCIPGGSDFDEHKMQKQIFDMLQNNAFAKLLKYFDGMCKLIIIKFYIRIATKYE